MSHIGWSEERIALLKKLHAEGKTASESARILGGGVTRNGVVGKWFRLKLPGRDKPSPPTMARPVRAPVVKPKIKPQDMRRPPKPGPQNRPAVVHGHLPNGVLSLEKADEIRVERAVTGAKALQVFAEPANDDAIPLMARKFDQCAWPVGSPDRPEGQLVCGAEVKPERSYCAHHCSIGFVPWTKKTSPSELARSLRRFCG